MYHELKIISETGKYEKGCDNDKSEYVTNWGECYYDEVKMIHKCTCGYEDLCNSQVKLDSSFILVCLYLILAILNVHFRA